MTKPPAIDYKRLIRETNKARRRLIRKLPGVQIATYARAIRGLSLEDAARHEAGHVLVGALTGGIVLAAAVVQLPGGVDGVAVVWTSKENEKAPARPNGSETTGPKKTAWRLAPRAHV